MIVEVIDDFLSTDDAYSVLDYCRMASYTYGETDTSSTPPTGMVHEICETDEIYKLFSSKTDLIAGDDLVLNRMYINCFAPTENPYFHTDCDEEGSITFLYYSSDEWELDLGGETQFYANGQIAGVPPVPNRMGYFDSSILHRATTYRDRHRFTIAIKYVPDN